MASAGRAALLRRVALLERQHGTMDVTQPADPFEFMRVYVSDWDAIDRELMPKRATRPVLAEVKRAVEGDVTLQQVSDAALEYLIDLFVAMVRDAGMNEEDLQRLLNEA